MSNLKVVSCGGCVHRMCVFSKVHVGGPVLAAARPTEIVFPLRHELSLTYLEVSTTTQLAVFLTGGYYATVHFNEFGLYMPLVRVRVCTCVCVCVCARAHTHAHARHTHARARAHTHTHTHVSARRDGVS